MEDSKPLPEKKYFKIGEVADLVGVEPHVLRYWETQFPQVRPHKARSGHRLYRRREVETLLVIRELVHVQRFTIAGARQALRQPGGAQSLMPRFFDPVILQHRPASEEQASAAGIPAPAKPGRLSFGVALAEPTASHPGSEHSDSGDGLPLLVEVEAHGLDEDQLREALERQAAGDDEEPSEPPDGDIASFSGALPERSAEARVREDAALPAISSTRRRLLEDALHAAQSVITLLEREEGRARAQA